MLRQPRLFSAAAAAAADAALEVLAARDSLHFGGDEGGTGSGISSVRVRRQ